MEEIYNGKPSIVLDHRPFYSITIPCYNSGKKIPRLLDSIVAQDMADDIEVIICDDHSTEPYQDVIDRYKDKLCIKQVQTDYNKCPGNTREKAAHYATGEWLLNCDHDDSLVEGALKIVKDAIIANNEDYMVRTNYNEIEIKEDGTEKLLNVFRTDMLLTHGKFFNIDNLWRGYDIHYKKDMQTHEDIYISQLINTILEKINHKPLIINQSTYNFYQHQTSINSTKYKHCEVDGVEHPFIEVYYCDWADSRYGVFPIVFARGNLMSMNEFVSHMMGLVLFDYGFLQAFMYRDKENYLKKNMQLAKYHLKYLKTITSSDIDQIIVTIMSSQINLDNLKTVKKMVTAMVGPYEEKYTIGEWLLYIDE